LPEVILLPGFAYYFRSFQAAGERSLHAMTACLQSHAEMSSIVAGLRWSALGVHPVYQCPSPM
jgi:hypothetical protein